MVRAQNKDSLQIQDQNVQTNLHRGLFVKGSPGAPGRNHNMLGPSEGCSAGKVPETKKLHVIFYDMSNDKKNNGCLGYNAGDEILHSDMGIIINHQRRILSKQPEFHGK